ncbi:MAG: radical SAM protein [Candidatus Nezhaarchaeota archaeon]|nr:radical SAM protein [Candidatus Nezhaarchaeota archaeon]
MKPFFHFWPGSTALTFSTWSCNLNCAWCQNWHLSRARPEPRRSHYISPEKIVSMAERAGDEGTCVSFNEPAMLFEYSLDVFRLARQRGLYNTYVSNGYLTPQAIRMLRASGLDAIKIDVKGSEETYRKFCAALSDKPVWEAAKEAKKLGLHVEIVNLLVRGVNDDEDSVRGVIEKHLRELGPEIPVHFTRYFPAYKFTAPATDIRRLEEAWRLAKKMGIWYAYLGNVPGHSYENTYCHHCGRLLIERLGFKLINFSLKEDKCCPSCGERVPIVGRLMVKRRPTD